MLGALLPSSHVFFVLMASWLHTQRHVADSSDEEGAHAASTDIYEWARSVMHAAIGHLLKERSTTPLELLACELLKPHGGLANYVILTFARLHSQVAHARSSVAKYKADNLRTERASMSRAIARVLTPCMAGEPLPDDAACVLYYIEP